MSSKKLKWVGIACVALSAISAGIGFLFQALFSLFCLFFAAVIIVPIMAVEGVVGPATIDVPRVLPVALSLSALLLTMATACFVTLAYRGLSQRRIA